ncbi:MAG: molybdopterin converting factor subunit 1 [Alphaproteobacteria bacterium]|nr:molybdopterin converting factor subunit 1 [Alphaproteobacteria bacterium]
MKVRYFAWLRTKVGKSAEDIDPPGTVRTVGDLMTWLAEERPGFAEALGRPGVVRAAVNQNYAEPEHPVKPGDEVAFFPPVTGG